MGGVVKHSKGLVPLIPFCPIGSTPSWRYSVVGLSAQVPLLHRRPHRDVPADKGGRSPV